MIIRVKKKHIRDEPNRRAMLIAALKEATRAVEVSFTTPDGDDLAGIVAVCRTVHPRYKYWMNKELLLPKGAADFLASKVNTLRPFRFSAKVGWFS